MWARKRGFAPRAFQPVGCAKTNESRSPATWDKNQPHQGRYRRSPRQHIDVDIIWCFIISHLHPFRPQPLAIPHPQYSLWCCRGSELTSSKEPNRGAFWRIKCALPFAQLPPPLQVSLELELWRIYSRTKMMGRMPSCIWAQSSKTTSSVQTGIWNSSCLPVLLEKKSDFKPSYWQPEIIILNEVRQKEKDCIVSLICGI